MRGCCVAGVASDYGRRCPVGVVAATKLRRAERAGFFVRRRGEENQRPEPAEQRWASGRTSTRADRMKAPAPQLYVNEMPCDGCCGGREGFNRGGVGKRRLRSTGFTSCPPWFCPGAGRPCQGGCGVLAPRCGQRGRPSASALRLWRSRHTGWCLGAVHSTTTPSGATGPGPRRRVACRRRRRSTDGGTGVPSRPRSVRGRRR